MGPLQQTARIWFLAAVAAFGQETADAPDRTPPCHPEAARLSEGLDEASRYRNRGNRCEGVYRENFSSERERETRLVGVYSAVEAFEVDGLSSLHVLWPRVTMEGNPRVSLFAQSKKRGTFYRMDATEAADEVFLWPTDILHRVGLEWEQIALLGWRDVELRGETTSVYLPLRIVSGEPQPEGGATRPDSVFVDVQSNLQIRAAHVSVARLVEGGLQFDAREEPLVPREQPTGSVTRYRVQLAESAPLHRVEFSLTLADGSAHALQFHCAAFTQSDEDGDR